MRRISILFWGGVSWVDSLGIGLIEFGIKRYGKERGCVLWEALQLRGGNYCFACLICIEDFDFRFKVV